MAIDEYARTGSTTLGSTSSASVAGDDPSKPHPGYEIEKARRGVCRMLWDGTEAVRAAGDAALMPYQTEDPDDYEERKQLAAVLTAFGECVEVTVGLLTVQEPTFSEKMPAALVDFWKTNVDAKGNDGPVFSENLLIDSCVDGLAGIFTDMPRIVDRKKLDPKRAKELNIRPYWILVQADDEIFPVYEPVNGVETLVLFVRREVAQVRDPAQKFVLTTVYRYHCYENIDGVITATTYEAPDADTTPTLVADSKIVLEKQTEIPWSPLETGREMSDGTLSPPFLELAYLILEYHEIKTGRISLIRRACATTLVTINMPLKKDGTTPDIDTGPGSAIHTRFKDGQTIPTKPVYYVSPDVSVLDPSKDMQESTRSEIAVAGGKHLSPDKKGVEAAKTVQLGNRARNASISRIARRWQQCLRRAFGHASAYMGLGPIPDGAVTVSMRFEEALMEPNVMLAYGKLIELGLHVKHAVRALKQQGRIAPDANEEEVVREWELGLAAMKAAKELEEELDRQGDDDEETPPEPKPEVKKRSRRRREPAGAAA